MGIFTLTMAVTALSVFAIERADRQREIAQLDKVAQEVSSGLERRANGNAAYLRSAAALFATRRSVEASLFRSFVGQLQMESSTSGVNGIGWGMRVASDDVPMVERVMRNGSGHADEASHPPAPPFAVQPRDFARRGYAVPVMYLVPENARNRLSIGYDMASDPVRRAAMDRAELMERPIVSGKLQLVRAGHVSQQVGFVMYMPVFGSSRDDGSRTLRGFVFTPFAAEDFLRASMPADPDAPLGLRLYDGAENPGQLLAQERPEVRSGRVVRRWVDVAGRRWLLVVEAPATMMLGMLSVMTLLFGLLVATLLLVLARLVSQQVGEDRMALAWFEQQSSIRDSLTRELNHRVKNTLANVLSIIALTRRRARDLDSFVESLEGRIRALSATHDLLTQSDWGATPIDLVIRAELAPYAQGTDRHVDMAGPDVQLAPNDALSLGLAIHELATNAAKYGALSVPGGRVDVRWELASETTARISWREQGGPPIDPTVRRKRGFGTDLIEKIVAHELRNPVDLRFEADGVRCTLIIPVRQRGSFAIREGRPV
ncbi:CHASE domain-containing protein [Novosphingobium pokkalii]|uniref:histidine kinase n=1 Tax=Novosphingobium pokkalii TaxID=1770194 RepID=A0ABV7V725_9SPHN|nr:CHASE domain-containing protein [Novosphingobium pokkalii]